MAGAFDPVAFDPLAFDTDGASPVLPATPLSNALSAPTTRSSKLSPGYDLLLDPLTLDYVDTANGEWVETADSRTTVLCQIEMELNGSITDPGDGTRLRALRRAATPLTIAVVIDEVARALQVLIGAGIIADLVIDDGVDETGRTALLLNWTDRATGLPVDAVYPL